MPFSTFFSHITGHFLGSAHQVCNLNRKLCKRIPIFAHNLSRFDSHLIIRSLKAHCNVQALAKNTESFRTMNINSYMFLDSFSFMSTSLASMVDDLRASGHAFNLLNTITRDPAGKELLLRKGVYPYEYLTSYQVLLDTVELPAIEAFHSKVSNGGISQADYQHALKVWSHFKCTNLLEFTHLYCQLDVLLLAECVLAFRAEVKAQWGLDVCMYISLPQLAFDGMLLQTGARIELMDQEDMCLMIEGHIRGGAAFIGKRYEEAKEGDGANLATRILYLDANVSIVKKRSK